MGDGEKVGSMFDFLRRMFVGPDLPTLDDPFLGRLTAFDSNEWEGEIAFERHGFECELVIKGSKDQASTFAAARKALTELKLHGPKLRAAMLTAMASDPMTGGGNSDFDFPGVDYPATRLATFWGGRIGLASLCIDVSRPMEPPRLRMSYTGLASGDHEVWFDIENWTVTNCQVSG